MNTLAPFPTIKGTYILILQLASPMQLTIGRLGTFSFSAGWYAYVGSAFGAGGLRGRLKHHLSPVTKPHWHIDHLRQSATVCEVWWSADETRHEHHWSAILQAHPGASIPAPRFGASDCKCPSHLMYLAAIPDFDAFVRATQANPQRTPV